MVTYLRAWLGQYLDEKGAAATEYVLVILGVVLFMVIAAFALQGVLIGAVSAISTWIAGVTPPGIPGATS
jgi:uncharacterized protein (UPF0333 family)